MQHREPLVFRAQAFGDLPGAIARAVVDEDDFEVGVA